jgi:hypothetical protein
MVLQVVAFPQEATVRPRTVIVMTPKASAGGLSDSCKVK